MNRPPLAYAFVCVVLFVLAGLPVAAAGEPCGEASGNACASDEFCKLPPGQCDVAGLLGVCRPVPQVCALVFDPVCGCDGRTYGNACEADRAGAQIGHPGECQQVCGGIAGTPCDDGEFCQFQDGTCDVADNQGVCRPVPLACPDVWFPVCGCDGRTYSNRCYAAAAGAQVNHEGECQPQVCGGIAGIPCESGEFCQFPDGTCDLSDNQGVCRPIPQACPDVWDPVCGCDGQTYSNRCAAAAAGAQIAHEGQCPPPVCGGIAGLPCDYGQFCKLPHGQCDVADLQGICHPVPDACPEIYAPVCGCDGNTYSNVCEADRAGAQVDHDGECPQVCGGIAGIPCDEGEFCQFQDGTCDIADNQGVCRPIPQGCPDVWLPVCGCDGLTYSNRCEAAAAGAQIAHEGECLPQVCGGELGVGCDEGEFCQFQDGTCDVSDNQGVCRPIPQECPFVWDPVCGCDGQTYINRCDAAAAGAQVNHEGQCPPGVCGSIFGIPCDDGEFCKLPHGACDIADLAGVCHPIPDACPDVYEPVCGCNGTTYGNACEADRAGAQIDHLGECPQVCGGIAGIPCDDGEFCQFQDGTCDIVDNQGVCRPIPQACPDVWAPVCGCDGRTYSNRCDAAAAGAQVDHEGECMPQVCGGIAGIPCDHGEFCRLPRGECDVADLQGVCRPIPDACPHVYLPVCGCDGITYGNACEADRAGAQIDHMGECAPQVCGGIAGVPCDEGEFCKLPNGQCDVADLQGVCHPIPGACPLIYMPVCGCDGTTYGNACEADQAGAQIDHLGECPQVCGGIAGIPCDDGEFCQFQDGTCDIADNQGVCRPIPQACPDIWDPVCGCDGRTYSNRCDAAAAGAQVDHEGECLPQVCGGIAGIPCDDGEFCKLPHGQCDVADLQGVCHPIPGACPLIYMPVCGCDGTTYGNACEADQAGAQIDHLGECPQVCGGIAGIPCDDGEFCQFQDGTCDIADNQGVCRPIPQACPDIWDPVCGCDGRTYSNRCDAAAAGAQVDHEGQCLPEVCGGIAGIPCDDGEFCKLPHGQCDVADLQGVCHPIPGACPLIYMPVCGCDGTTYGNACEADQAGAQIDHLGECPQVCGGIAGIPCDDGEFCQFQDGTCDIADNQGVCRPIPQACPDIWDPVCGCDGRTYSNRCDAAAAGAQVDHEGECLPQVCGGIAGIPCDEGEFCLYPPGTCDFADHLGICVRIPEACPAICDLVCGCDGVTYGNRCLAAQAQVSLDHHGECEPNTNGGLIRNVRFDSHERMRWQPALGALSYNVYVEVHKTPPPENAGECYQSEVMQPATIIAPIPDEGTVWLIQVTGVFADGEGPMGISSDCTTRAPEAPCDPQ